MRLDRGAIFAGLLAFAAAAPSVWLPFVSDDWMHALHAAGGRILATPFGYSRPLCSISYWIDWQLWGLTPSMFHLTNVILGAISAVLVVLLVRRLTGEAFLSGGTGIIFALHPYHIGAIAWVSARSDLLSAVLVLLGALAYDRWRERLVGIPVLALLAYEAALLAKESGVVLAGFVIVLALFDRRRPATRAEALRGWLPFVAVGLTHFAVLRAGILGGIALNHLKWIGAWRGNLLAYGVTSVVPPPPEIFEVHPWYWGAAAVLVTGVLIVASLWRTRGVPGVIWPAAAVFVVLLGPSLIGFQQRYFFLPSAAAAQWTGWFVAARASERLMSGLVRASLDADAQAIVLAGAPHRVHGVPVSTDFTQAVPLLGGRKIAIHTAAGFDFPDDRSDALWPPRETAVVRRPEQFELSLGVALRPYSRRVLPLLPKASDRVSSDWGTIVCDGPHTARVEIRVLPGTKVFVWDRGDLTPLTGRAVAGKASGG